MLHVRITGDTACSQQGTVEIIPTGIIKISFIKITSERSKNFIKYSQNKQI